MMEILPALGALVFFGASSALTKDAVNKAGRYKAIVYGYLLTVGLLWAGALLFGLIPQFPQGFLLQYLAQIAVGTVAVIAFFKAIEHGSSSIIAVLGESYVIIVIAAGVYMFGESIGGLELAGAVLVLAASALVSLGNSRKLTLEPGVAYMAIAVVCWGYYYSLIKVFVSAMGPYGASLVLESGIMLLVLAYYLARGRDLSLPIESSRLSVFLRGLVVFAATICYSFSVQSIGAGLTSAIGAGGPIVTAVMAYFMFGEKLDVRKYAGIVLVVLGLIMISL